MMNINILNKVIKGISEQIPLVNSFYTQTPYESWNVAEVKYGSVSFVVTETTTNEQTTTYSGMLYYADRLTEDKSNLDSVHSDAATVIQTIVGALNQSDDEYILVDYPVGITLFEQSFCDNLAGGYANISINVEAMGECFTDEYSVPEIIGTSAYYTKDEIETLFPLREQLSTVAYSGSFSDLKDVPTLTTEVQYNNLYNRVSDVIKTTEKLESNKVDKTTFNEVIKSLGGDLSGVTTLAAFNAFVNGQNQINTNFAVELKNKVSSAYFQNEMSNINKLIDTKLSSSYFDTFKVDNNTRFTTLQNSIDKKVSNDTFAQTIDGVNKVITNVAVEVGTKLDKDYFDGWKDNIISTLSTKLATQTFTNTMSNIYTKSEVDKLVATGGGTGVDEEQVEEIVNSVVNDAIDNIKEDLIESVRVDLDSLVEEEIQSQVGEFVTQDQLEDVVLEQYNVIIQSPEFKEELSSVANETITELVGDIVTEAELKSKNYATKYYVDDRFNAADSNITATNERFDGYYNKTEVDNKVNNVKVDLSDYYTKSEVDNLDSSINSKFNNHYNKSEVYTKSEVDSKDTTINNKFGSYYTKSEVDNKVNNVKVDLSDYYTKEQINNIVDDINLDDYITIEDANNTFCSKDSTYTKTQIDNKDKILNNKFSSYYTKEEVEELVNTTDLSDYYTKSEVNELIDNIQIGEGGEVNLTNYYTKIETDNKYADKTKVYEKSQVYTKSEVYNKTEIVNNFYSKSQIDDIIDNIEIGSGGEVDLSNYYKKSETYNRTQIDDKIANVEVDLSSYYTKSQIDDIIDNIEIGSGGEVDLSNYYTKSESDTKYATKSNTYTKSEIDSKIGDIDSILNNVLYSK